MGFTLTDSCQLINCLFRLDVPSVISHLVHSLPPLPSCELTDPHDDVTLPRLIEALQHRYRIKQMMIDEYSQAGAHSHCKLNPRLSALTIR